MLGRIIHFLIGAVAAGGGGYLSWTHRASLSTLFPPGPDGVPWALVLGLAVVSAGIVFLMSAVMPRPQQAARRAAEAARRQEILAAADAYYAERARAADRDWRSGELAPLAEAMPPQPAPQPAPAPTTNGSAAPAVIKPSAAKPVASSVPPAAAMPAPFPAAAAMAPALDPVQPPPPQPLAAMAAQPAGQTQPAATPGTMGFAVIRAAIAEGRLDEADRMLAREREKAEGAALAELTGIAGDHAAAAGRESNAKWLWRLALKRFEEAKALATPAAQQVSASLRKLDPQPSGPG